MINIFISAYIYLESPTQSELWIGCDIKFLWDQPERFQILLDEPENDEKYFHGELLHHRWPGAQWTQIHDSKVRKENGLIAVSVVLLDQTIDAIFYALGKGARILVPTYMGMTG